MLIQANAVHIPLKDESVQLCAFSPPYWGLRKYSVLPMIWGGDECEHKWGIKQTGKQSGGGWAKPGYDKCPQKKDFALGEVSQGQFCQLCGAWRGDLGLEPTLELYFNHMMQVMAEVWRVLRNDGVCFVNIGDSYASIGRSGRKESPGVGATQAMTGVARAINWQAGGGSNFSWSLPGNIKPKSLCLIPQKFAIRCQEASWIIRSEIIWHKPNPIPESVKDRPTRSHEQVWMMTKQGKYYWDPEAVKEKTAYPNGPNSPQSIKSPHGQGYTRKNVAYSFARKTATEGKPGLPKQHREDREDIEYKGEYRNCRSVWAIATQPDPASHFATWPSKLVEKMIRVASRPGDIVLDPFCGTGKTLIEIEKLNRTGIGLDLSWGYLSDIAAKRLSQPIQRELAVL